MKRFFTFLIIIITLSCWQSMRAEGSPGPKIEGPWTWMIASTGGEGGAAAAASGKDFLARASGGAVTERHIANSGAIVGDPVGNRVWTAGKLAPKGNNNISGMLNRIGLGGKRDRHVAYGSISLNSPRQQRTRMHVGSDDAVKIWLNGALVHKKYSNRSATDYQGSFTVTLKAGKNNLLVAVYDNVGNWSGFFGFENDASYSVIPADTVLSISPSPVTSPPIGERLTFNVNIVGGESVAGYQVIVQFDPTALRYVETSKGDYLGSDAFFVPQDIGGGHLGLALTALTGVSSGDGTLSTITFEVLSMKASTLTLSEARISDSQGNTFRPHVKRGEVLEPPDLKTDVNDDGVVNIQDLVWVAIEFGKTGQISADVNDDRVVNIADLVLVAGDLGTRVGASPLYPDALAVFTVSEVREWLSQAYQLNNINADYQRGILVLEQLLAALTPKETRLLSNYPNPFNPETWIPYQLAKASDVKITIYDTRGVVVRKLELGYQPPGYYTERSRAAYWDGRNNVGERVASGLYFYQLQADNVSLLRKMLILK